MKTARRLCVLAVLAILVPSTSVLAQSTCNFDFQNALSISRSRISVGESATLTWCNPATTGTNSYVVRDFEVYISQSIRGPFQLLRTLSNTTISTNLSAGAGDAGRTYYFYVVADGCQNGVTGGCAPAPKQTNTVSLAVNCTTTARGVRSGSDDSTLRSCTDTTPFSVTDILTLRWDPRNDVQGFQVELYSVDASGNQTRILLQESGPTAIGLRLSSALPAGSYCFRVRGFQTSSQGKETGEEQTPTRTYCDWSALCCFRVAPSCPTTAPVPIAPAAASTVLSPVQFSWTGVSNATSYEVVVRRAGIISSAGKTTGTTLTGALAPGAVEWWVEASFTGCPAVRSTVIPFTVSAAPEPARIVLTALPEGMLQPPGSAGASDRFSLTNVGGTAAKVTLTGTGDFFNTSPVEVQISPGQTVLFTIQALARPAGLYQASIAASVTGQPQIVIPVKLLATDPPPGPVSARPEKNRVDVAAPPGFSPSGSVSFRNEGAQQLKGIVIADVPWLVPQISEISIAPGAAALVPFVMDRSKRPDAGDLVGSVNGTLALRFMTGSSTLGEGRFVAFDSPGSTSKLATATDTVQSPVSTRSVPALRPGEIAWFVPGVGHVQGSNNRLFISDVSILNQTSSVVRDIQLYFVPRGTSSGVALSTAIDRLQGGLFTRYNDVAQSIFSNSSTVGSLQIRSTDAAQLSINANIFNTSNPAGSYGTTVPAFRSDRSSPLGESLLLTGLRADAAVHTNLYLQETEGVTASIETTFLNASGGVTGQRSDILPPFELLQAGAVPAGTVSTVVTNRGNGKIAAYATPVDDASFDTWAVADWRKVFRYDAGETVVIPIAGSTPGANDSLFRSDIAFFNNSTSSAGGTLRYFPRGGDPAQMEVVIAPRSTRILTDIVATLGRPLSIGYLTFTPNSSAIALTSRAYTIVPGSTETYGTAVPALGSSSELRLGQSKRFGAVDDASIATVNARAGNTFRTNFGLVETAGSAVSVRVTLHYTYAAGSVATARGIASQTFDLQPRGFLLVSNVSRALIGAARDTSFGDLNDLQVEFEVIAGEGAVIPFLTSTDNGTNDSILRVE